MTGKGMIFYILFAGLSAISFITTGVLGLLIFIGIVDLGWIILLFPFVASLVLAICAVVSLSCNE